MGYMRHHAIVVTSEVDELIVEARVTAIRIFGDAVSEISQPAINNSRSFFIPPDGSKEGWPESDNGDAKRNEFIQYLREQYYTDGSSSLKWAEIQYGDDDCISLIVRSSDNDYLERSKRP